MIAKDIPRNRWQSFLEQLSFEREGWRANVERVGSDPATVSEVGEHGMEAVRFELEQGYGQIVVELGDEAPIALVSPSRISLSEADEELQDEILEIESSTETLRMHLRLPRPFEIDDVGLPSEEVGLDESLEPVEDELQITEE